MQDLEKARAELNKIDEEMAILFERRMKAVSEVASNKKRLGLPVENGELEADLISKKAENISDSKIKSYYVNFLEDVEGISKSYQHFLMNGMRVAFSGVEGAFASIAAKNIFPDGELVPFGDFKEAYKAVENGVCDCAVLPIENSFAGDVGQVMDMGYMGSLFINGIYELHITQNLLGTGTDISKVKEVISHPQALSQCASFIKEMGYQKREATNTAAAAKYVAEMNDPTIAAIASEDTAHIYGLNIMQRAINEDANNTTRFAVFSRIPNSEERNHFILFFTVKNEAGSLSKAISIMGEYGFNLQALKSRPTKESGWEYYFYVEGEGDLTSVKGEKMLSKLHKICRNVKNVGAFRKVVSLKV